MPRLPGLRNGLPSGVQYGKLIEPFRVAMAVRDRWAAETDDWFHRWILFGCFRIRGGCRNCWCRRASPSAWADRGSSKDCGLTRLLPPRLRQLVAMLPPPKRRGRRLPEFLPAVGKPRARVALFTGCVADVMFRHTHWATARVLQQNGCDVLVPRSQVCCGAIHFHAGSSEPAREFADANLAAFESTKSTP